MTILYINTGSSANAGDGDTLRTAFNKVNANFTYLSTASFSGGGGAGAPGPSGPRGPQGVAGNTGPQGPQGPGADQRLNTTSNVTFTNITIVNTATIPSLRATAATVGTLNASTVTSDAGFFFNLTADGRTDLASLNVGTNAVVSGVLETPSALITKLTATNATIANLTAPAARITVVTATNLFATIGSVNTLTVVNKAFISNVDVTSTATFTGNAVFANTASFRNILPSADATYNLGSPTQRWKNLYVSTSTIYLAGDVVTVAAGQLTVNGNPVLGTATNTVLGGIKIGHNLAATSGGTLTSYQSVIDSSPPYDAQESDQWFDAVGGKQYVFYQGYWVETNLTGVGDPGARGPSGPVGPKGNTGDQGISVTLVGSTATSAGLPLTGNAGDGWIVNDTGNLWFWSTANGQWEDIGQIVGPQGDAGDPGPEGPSGPSGPSGPIGYQGASGPSGAPSTVAGPSGPSGAQGDPGVNADFNYLGAFQIGSTYAKNDIVTYEGASYVAKGTVLPNIGSPDTNSTDWQLVTARGPSGPQGIQGPQGAQGNTGPSGPSGAQGNAGPSGVEGPSGPSGAQGERGEAGGNANTANFVFTASQMSVTTNDDITVVTNGNTWTFGANGTLSLPTSNNDLYITNNALIKSFADIQIAAGDDVGSNWIFGGNGTLTFPSGNLSIGGEFGDYIVGSTGTIVGVVAQGQAGAVGIQWIDDISNAGSTTTQVQVAGIAVNGPLASTTGTVQIVTGFSTGTTVTNTWEFGVDGTLTAPGALLPNADLAYDLGSTTTQWRSIYVGTGTIYIGGVALGVNENNYVTVDGNPIITVNTTGNLTVQGDTNIVLGAVLISDTAPAATTPGSQWFNTLDGRTYIAYSGQWIDASPTIVPQPSTYLDQITIDGDTLNINGGTLTIDDTGTLLVNGAEVTGGNSGSGDSINNGPYSVSIDEIGAVTMETGRGTILFGNIPDNPITGSTHFHIMKDSPSTVDLFFGDDYNYVKLPTTQGVEIGAQGNVWHFSTTGTLTLPNGGNISSGMGAIRLEPANASAETQALLIYPTVQDGNHIHLTAGGGETDLYLGNDNQYVKVDHSGTVVIGTYDETFTTSTWIFGTDGSLTLPDGAPILFGGNNCQIQAAQGFNISSDGGIVVSVTGNQWLFGPDGELELPEAGTILGSGADPNVYIETSTTATTSTWSFGTDGILTLPAATPVIRGGGTGTDVTVIASDDTTTSTWTFAADGGLTFPDSSIQTQAWNNANFMTAMAGYNGEIITNTATVGVGGLVVNGPVTFNGPFTYQTTATTAVTGNTGTFYGDVYGVGALYAGVAGYSPLPATVFQSSANVNGYIQNNFQNLNNGVQASTEWVATANNGDDSNHYLDMGIAGGAWDGSQTNSVGTAAQANDSWIYAQGSTSTSAGGNLILGTIKNGKSVKILTGSTGSGSIVATFNGSGVNATTTNTGALQVIGGIGVSGSVYAGSIYSGDGYFRGPSGYGQLQLVSGGELYIPSNLVMSSGGLIKGPGGSTHIGLLSGTGGSVRFYNTVTISGSVAATSTITGALTVVGGVGLQGSLYVGLAANITGNILGYGSIVRTGNRSLAAWGGNGAGIVSQNATYTDTSSAGTLATSTINYIGQPTLAFSSTTTVTQANTLYISSAPVAGTNATITTGYALNVASGASHFGGNVVVDTYVTQTAKPAFRVYGTVSTDINTGTTLSATQGILVDYNQGSYYSTSTGVFTAPVAGLYHCYATVRVGSNNGLNQAAILKNNTTTSSNVISFWETDTNVGTAVHFSMNGYARLGVGDTVRLNVITGKIQFDSNDSWGVTFIG